MGLEPLGGVPARVTNVKVWQEVLIETGCLRMGFSNYTRLEL